MNRQIALQHLTAELSAATGQPASTCESFLRQLFSTVGKALVSEETVRIPGLGTFRRFPKTDATGFSVAFTPARELSELTNAPFEMFDAVELSADIDLDQLEAVSDEPAPSRESDGTEQTARAAEFEEREDANGKPEEVEGHEEEEKPKTEEKKEEENEPEKEENPEEEKPTDAEPEESEPQPECPVSEKEVGRRYRRIRRKSCRFGWGFFTGFISAIVILAIAFGSIYLVRGYQEKLAANEAAAKAEADSIAARQAAMARQQRADSIAAAKLRNDSTVTDDSASADQAPAEEVDTKPSDTPVYDVISHTRYLTTMAKEHYGNMNFWPYIYEENKAILGHPDRIRPGTRVVVPPLSKYGVRADNKSDELAAKRKGVEIYSRYRKKR